MFSPKIGCDGVMMFKKQTEILDKMAQKIDVKHSLEDQSNNFFIEVDKILEENGY